VDYAELCHLRQNQEQRSSNGNSGGSPLSLSPDSTGPGSKVRRVVPSHEPVVYAQIDYSRKGLCSSPLSSVGTGPLSSSAVGLPTSHPAVSHGFREIVTVRTPLMANQQESCV